MKLSSDQMNLGELRNLKVHDRLVLHLDVSPSTRKHMRGIVSQVLPEIFIVKYFREGNPNWETAFFWNDFGADGTTVGGDYLWSFSRD